MDLVQPGEELQFYRKGILDLTQRGAEANTAKGDCILKIGMVFNGIPEILIIHLIYNNLL